jgi:O-antigen/teichoic acid export membrane protein
VLAVTAAILAPLVMRAAPAGHPQAPAPSVRALFGRSLVPLVVLTVAALAQNVDVIVAQHRLDASSAGSYAAAAVAAKAVVWLAIGLTIYALPDVLRDFPDERRLLWAALPAVGAAILGMVAIYAVAGRPLLSLVFGSSMDGGASALPWLGLATGLLVASCLSVQHLSERGRPRFVWLLAGAALIELAVLMLVSASGAREVAFGATIVQLVLVVALAATLQRSVAGNRTRPTI